MIIWKAYEKHLKDLEKLPEGTPIEHPPMSMLLMLWHVYDCWDQPYYDRIVNVKDKIATSVFKYDAKLPEFERNLLQDKILLGYNPNYEHDPHVFLAVKEQTDEIVNVLVNHYSKSKRFQYFASKAINSVDAESKLEIVARVLTEHFIDKHQIWVYMEGDELRTIRAVALWEPPQRKPALPLPTTKRVKLAKNIGVDLNKPFFSEQKKLSELRNTHYHQLQCDFAVLHYFAYWHEPDDTDKYKFCQTVLLFDIAEALPDNVPAYAQTGEDYLFSLQEIGYSIMEPKEPGVNNENIDIFGLVYIKENLE